jgi:DNA-directed RNA polymerase
MHSKTKINLKTTVKDKFDNKRQLRSLMPNLIHSLDATSMSLLHKQFMLHYEDQHAQLFSIHDCFGTTCDKVVVLKAVLASVYTDLYSSNQYLIKFDGCILDNIENNTNYTLDRVNRIVYLPKNDYKINDVE